MFYEISNKKTNFETKFFDSFRKPKVEAPISSKPEYQSYADLAAPKSGLGQLQQLQQLQQLDNQSPFDAQE